MPFHLIPLAVALLAGTKTAIEIPKLWRERKPVRTDFNVLCSFFLLTFNRKMNQQTAFHNHVTIVDMGRAYEVQANKALTLSRDRNQRVMVRAVSRAMQNMHDTQMAQNAHYNKTIQDMLKYQTTVQLSTDRLHAIMLENSTRLLERAYDDQFNQRTVSLCLTVIIAYFAYLVGVFQTENSWLKKMPLSPLATGDFQVISSQPDYDAWIPTLDTTRPVVQSVAIWAVRALGGICAGLQVRGLYLTYTNDRRSSGWVIVYENADYTLWPSLCSLVKPLAFYLTAADPTPWIIAGWLFDCLFLYYVCFAWQPRGRTAIVRTAKFMAKLACQLLAFGMTFLQTFALFELYIYDKFGTYTYELALGVTLISGLSRLLWVFLTYEDRDPWILGECMFGFFFVWFSSTVDAKKFGPE